MPGKATNSNVTLTVEGGVSLVGPHCPGTVRLFCEGVELAFIRWTYNAGNFIGETIEIDYMVPSSIYPENPAFIAVDITNVSVDNKTMLANNFSSVLTVNLLELNKQNIQIITCGDPQTEATLKVDIQDIFTPNVNASYLSGMLSTVDVHWTNLVG